MPKIALVKQNVYEDLYNCKYNISALDKLLSSNQRTGPVGLLAAFNPDFYIVEIEADDESSIWREKYQHLSIFTEDGLLSNRDHDFYRRDGSYQRQSSLTVNPNTIDWNQYDYVITYDYAVPSRIAKAFPGPIWCNYVTEGFIPAFKQATQSLPDGYSINLNHHFRPDDVLQASTENLYPDITEGSHSFDFPYFIQYYGCFHDLYKTPLTSPKHGVVLDPDTKDILSVRQIEELEKIGPVTKISGCVWDVIEALLAAKYYLRLSDRAVLGNSSIEAVASGCLFLTSPVGIKNWYLMDERATANGSDLSQQFENALKLINNFEKNPALHQEVVMKQREKLNYLCFERPLSQLLKIKGIL